jgi:hypothetical protein
VKFADGFVGGYWLDPVEGEGFGFVLFETKDQARRSTPPVSSRSAPGVAIRSVDVVAPPARDWYALFEAWGFQYQTLHVSLSIRSENNLVLLTLKEVIPLHFAIQPLDWNSKVVRALLSFGSQQVAVSRVQPVTVSMCDRYMPPAVQRGIPSGRFR